ncbi:MAG: transglycosylase domain-containing protein [Clostridia bacterium]|nr:transglycosylase domain-containing protein [Clostridia bacterium]MDD4376190.1 transglycosylase domain-containing protein [Clostridia bacterium]
MKFLKRSITTIIVVCIIAGSIITYKGYGIYEKAIAEISLEEKITEIKEIEDYTEFKDLPNDYKSAIIDVEDQDFYKHFGISLKAIVRSFVNNIKAFKIVEGGSTITQQLSKNLYFTQEQEILRKVAEMFVAFDIEKAYSKDDILEFYVNTSYFGDGHTGIGQACKGYLNKKPSEMTLLDSTLMAGVPNAPSVYAPTINPDLAVKRQIIVIKRMLDQESLSKEDADKLIKQLTK